MSTAIKKEVAFDEACRFLIKLGEAAHAYGSTAARLEGIANSKALSAL